jgi:cell division protease FtsH
MFPGFSLFQRHYFTIQNNQLRMRGGEGRMRSSLKIFIWLATSIIVITILMLLLACTSAIPTNAININLSEAIALSKSNNIQSMHLDMNNGIMIITTAVDDSSMQIIDVNGSPVQITTGSQLAASTGNLNLADLQELGMVLPANYSTTPSSSNNLGNTIISWFPLLLLFFLLFFLFRSGGGIKNQVTNYSRSKARLSTGNTPSVTFTDVAGEEEAKQDLHEVVDFLKNRAKFQAVGAKIPKGVLLVGPPGTGKTLLARAVAGEAGVPFFSISGSEFVEVFVGVGASRVRDLFEQAKQNRPCIIFIDEIDAVGRRRGSGLSGSFHEEREQTLNQILTEMDGFMPNAGVIVLAATNRPDVLDPALLRPGRFDRRITLELPDIGERLAILKVHAVGKPLDETVNLETIAKETHGFSGADLANLVNEAAILTARRNETSIHMDELEEAIDRIVAGPQRKSRKISQQERRVAAYHEAGHALVARMLPNADPVHKISIVTRGGMGGYTRLLPIEEHYLMTRSQFKDMLATFLGGHAAEELIFHEVTTGPHSDIKQATTVARKMITEYGMSETLPLRTFGSGEEEDTYFGAQRRDYSEEVAKQIDDEVRTLIDTANDKAKLILKEHRLRLIHLAEKLIIAETLEGLELEKAFEEPIPPEETYQPQEQKLQPVKAISGNIRQNQSTPEATA